MKLTKDRAKEIIDTMSDDDLIDIATTCSDNGLRLSAEIHLRRRYPSKVKIKSSEDMK